MASFQKIEQNLRRFVRQFYISALIKGLLMFFFVGLLFAILLLITEHFLWFNPALRTFLFWFTIVFEFVVFYGLVLNPILKLLEIQNGIGYEFASKIIGDHFPEIKDKLLNVLQLKKQSEQSELLLASIAQKSDELKTFSFIPDCLIPSLPFGVRTKLSKPQSFQPSPFLLISKSSIAIQ